MTALTIAAITPQDAVSVVFKALAVLGGAVVGGLLIGMLVGALWRALTSRPMAVTPRRIVRLVGGVAAGWFVAMWVFGPGGSWLWGGQGGEGGNGKDRQADVSDDKTEEPRKDRAGEDKPGRDADPRPPSETVRVEVLGPRALKLLGEEKGRTYRLDDDKERYDFAGLTDLLRRRAKGQEGPVRVLVVLYNDSPSEGVRVVDQLTDWLERQKPTFQWKFDPTREPSPEVRRAGP
jgi:hypothetical protein